ncbi:HAD-IC family P-type ATPase [Agromyces aerolatus]|uniref:HAD-IC family P-type ATPase n=1 Tax=Agromyces sp. LY-1074 TaxID=3074080 RepID=UPI00285DF3B2|nr:MULTISPECIES: HAD-IC family P-type ATPase [unclassified Agromyces]MDR5698504.1 HAD-IC family P-type ATPase [Agromyces sp. LY-1074]MDR5704798.1 HAD-IC family P-type ATPase [Agromyces sp. LY-1358]
MGDPHGTTAEPAAPAASHAPGTFVAERGLTAAEVAERVASGRANTVTDASSRSIWSILRANVLTLFNGIVVAGFTLLLILGYWQDALFGLAAIANAVVGVTQEYRAKRALDRLALMHAPKARVLRDGVEQEIEVRGIVLDDLLVVRSGDQITADASVLDATRLEADESLLTGESDPVDKLPGDRLLSGSIVVGGDGLARVTAVGDAAFAAKLTAEAKRFSLVNSELRRSIDRILRWITWAIFPIMAIVVNANMQAAGGWEHAIDTGEWREAAVASVAAVIAMIPLGLVLMTSIAFAVGAVRLSMHQVLVQELPAVEGLARVDVICLDKTGTITTGEVRFDAVHALDDGRPGDDLPEGWRRALAWYGTEPAANATARCLTDEFTDASPEASARIEFSSARKWSAVSFDDDARGTWVLGAPEFMFSDGDGAEASVALERARTLAATGRRTLLLGFAPEPLTEAETDRAVLPAGLRPVVLLTFREVVRSDAAATLAYFEKEGVGVRIISGDNPLTVAAVAREVGLDAGDGFDARELPADQADLTRVLDEHLVFGRVSPTQKRDMVRALKAGGHTVAMTGDGVNDALAIKDADLGIAMASGSAATRAVARIVLLDGRFSHLPGVVAEGRKVIANIERVSMLFLSKTSYAIAMSVLFGILLWPFPLLPRQLSITDGLTIGIPAFLLAMLPNARRYVPGFLRRSLSFAIPAGLVVAIAIAIVSGHARALGEPEAAVRTASMVTLALIGLWILTVLSRPFTWIKAAVVLAMVAGLVLVLTVPIAIEFLQLQMPGPGTLIDMAIVVPASWVALEVIGLWHRRRFGTASEVAAVERHRASSRGDGGERSGGTVA